MYYRDVETDAMEKEDPQKKGVSELIELSGFISKMSNTHGYPLGLVLKILNLPLIADRLRQIADMLAGEKSMEK